MMNECLIGLRGKTARFKDFIVLSLGGFNELSWSYLRRGNLG